ncbi:MAG TPA: ComEA family DNA-binding protein [Anaerolineae bacterium]|nr:ComEA family DNA-binding protein [Anaerolineae bacterium]
MPSDENVLLDKNRIVWLVVGVFLGIIVGVGGLTLSKQVQPAPIVIVPPEPTPAPAATATPAPIRVFVNGQVAEPAVYELPPGSLVEMAIEAAGGFAAEADTAVVNLAQPLSDGVQVYVPSEDEDVPVPRTIVSNPNTSPSTISASGSPAVGLININTATIEELDALPGVGPSTAQKIIEHRESSGPFAAIENIMDVTGIGEAKFAKIKDQITVGE